MAKIVIGLVGMPCAGKGEAAKVAEKNFGFRIVKFRDVVKDEALRLGISEGPLTLTKTGSLLRELEGPDAVARRVAARIRHVREDRIFVEGIRSYPEMRVLKRAFPNFFSIGIISPRHVRLRRALRRMRWDDPKTTAELSRKDRIEKSWGVTEALSKSDILIDNDGDLPPFRRLVASTIKRIFSGHGI